MAHAASLPRRLHVFGIKAVSENKPIVVGWRVSAAHARPRVHNYGLLACTLQPPQRSREHSIATIVRGSAGTTLFCGRLDGPGLYKPWFVRCNVTLQLTSDGAGSYTGASNSFRHQLQHLPRLAKAARDSKTILPSLAVAFLQLLLGASHPSNSRLSQDEEAVLEAHY